MQQDIGNTDEALAKADPARVDQQVINNFYGGNNFIAGTVRNMGQIGHVDVVTGDIRSLSATLKEIGIDDADLNLLEIAIHEDPAKPENNSLGKKVTAWIGNMAVKATQGAFRVGTEVGTKVATEALLKYYGLV